MAKAGTALPPLLKFGSPRRLSPASITEHFAVLALGCLKFLFEHMAAPQLSQRFLADMAGMLADKAPRQLKPGA